MIPGNWIKLTLLDGTVFSGTIYEVDEEEDTITLRLGHKDLLLVHNCDIKRLAFRKEERTMEELRSTKVSLIYKDKDGNEIRKEQDIKDKLPEHKGCMIIQL